MRTRKKRGRRPTKDTTKSLRSLIMLSRLPMELRLLLAMSWSLVVKEAGDDLGNIPDRIQDQKNVPILGQRVIGEEIKGRAPILKACRRCKLWNWRRKRWKERRRERLKGVMLLVLLLLLERQRTRGWCNYLVYLFSIIFY